GCGPPVNLVRGVPGTQFHEVIAGAIEPCVEIMGQNGGRLEGAPKPADTTLDRHTHLGWRPPIYSRREFGEGVLTLGKSNQRSPHNRIDPKRMDAVGLWSEFGTWNVGEFRVDVGETSRREDAWRDKCDASQQESLAAI